MTTQLLRLAGISAFLAFGSLLPAAIAPAENLLPADTVAFFSVPDANAVRTATKQSPMLMFWNDPAMKPFHDKFMAQFNAKFIAPLEADLGMKVAPFLDLLQGQLTVGATVNGSNGHDDIPAGLVVLLDAKGKSAALKTNLVALTKKWTDSGRALRTEKIRGLTFTVLPLSTNDLAAILPKRTPVQELGKEPKPEKPTEIYFTQFESLLVVANSAKLAETLAARLTGGNLPALADDPIFQADKPALLRESPLYYGWFNAKVTFDLIAKAPEPAEDENNPFAPKFSPAKILEATGLNGVKSASFAVRDNREGSSLVIHLTAPAATRTGLVKIIALPAKDASIPAFVPAEAVKFSRFRLDGKQTWAELQKLAAAISPQAQAGLNSAIDMANMYGQQKNPAFDIRTSLFGNLGDDIITYQKPVSGDSLVELANPPTLYLVAVSNPEEVISAIKTIGSLAAPQDAAAAEPREFLGHKIYTLALRGKGQKPLLIATSSGYLALSTDTGILEEYLRAADGKIKPLRDNPALANAIQQLGNTGGGIFGYENQRETMRVTFRAFKNTAANALTSKVLPVSLTEWADFSLLPDYDKVQKYFYLSVFGGNANADGQTLKIYTPRSPQLN
jgi:hypothetical protein